MQIFFYDISSNICVYVSNFDHLFIDVSCIYAGGRCKCFGVLGASGVDNDISLETLAPFGRTVEE